VDLKVLLEQLHTYARDNRVPIVRDETARRLYQLIQDRRPKRILEIGTAIGYSAMLMKCAADGSQIVTIEKDEARYNEAVSNINRAGISGVQCILGDAYEVLSRLCDCGEKFDFVFIDGPKGYYYRYLQIVKSMLENDSCIFADNVGFFGMVASGVYPHRHKTIVVSLQNYLNEVSHTPFESEIQLDIDDGYAITYYKGGLK